MNPTDNQGSTTVGCLIGFGFNLMLLFSFLFAQSIALFMFAGLIQLVYIVPLVMHFRKKGEARTVTGLIISGSAFFLLTTACAAILR